MKLLYRLQLGRCRYYGYSPSSRFPTRASSTTATASPPPPIIDDENSSSKNSNKNCADAAAVDITLKGMALNIFLTGTKFAGGIVSNSPALISDAAHSFSDIATDCV